jgi:hypothetical protein
MKSIQLHFNLKLSEGSSRCPFLTNALNLFLFIHLFLFHHIQIALNQKTTSPDLIQLIKNISGC